PPPDEPPGMPPPDEPPPGSWTPPPGPLLPPLTLTDAQPVTKTAAATMAMQALGNDVRNRSG
ncbi:MAG: hypothetical protein OEM50_08635, partial [Gammaproteobacteria bacterium]|nr:hypothetical protein [Gammaproteobacteria bacterium]